MANELQKRKTETITNKPVGIGSTGGNKAMASIQLALSNASMADDLQGLLARSTDLPVRRVDKPDTRDEGVVVVDIAHLSRLGSPLEHPERVVLITSNNQDSLDDAWNAGVNSVVSERDPLSTMVLAVLSACLRTEPHPRKPGEKIPRRS